MSISLVIPGRNCQRTIGACLAAVTPLLEKRELHEIVFVDDGSTDDTARIVADFPARIVRGSGGGAGAARNLGWRAAQGEWIWFVDADCVPRVDALRQLVTHLHHPRLAGVGGSYDNHCPASLVASLIHEEIVARHARMPSEVNFLATFNVLYRRELLAEVGGFDERRYNGPGIAAAEDAELAFRLTARGYVLRFNPASRVAHYHPTSYPRYLKVQQRHGFYRMRLYADYPGRAAGDSYSSTLDHIQPPLAMLALAAAPLAALPYGWLAPGALWLALAGLQLPMATRLVRRTRQARYLAYVPFGAVRAVARGCGMTAGVVDVLAGKARNVLKSLCWRRTAAVRPPA